MKEEEEKGRPQSHDESAVLPAHEPRGLSSCDPSRLSADSRRLGPRIRKRVGGGEEGCGLKLNRAQLGLGCRKILE